MPFHLDICTLEPLVTEDTLEPMKFLPARERVLTCSIDSEEKDARAVSDTFSCVKKRDIFFSFWIIFPTHPMGVEATFVFFSQQKCGEGSVS